MTTTKIVDAEQIGKEVEEDEELQKMKANLKEGVENEGKYQWTNNKLLYKGMIVLSKDSAYIP